MSALWHGIATLAAPALRLHLRRRAQRGKEEASRLAEREGHGAARPPGRLFWLHAASVGESLSVLPLLEAMLARDPDVTVLLTTGTVTSAALLPKRLPEALTGRVQHRYAPLDVPGWVERFLEGWRPDAAGFVESELWPNTLDALSRRGIPVALVNARLSARSFERWRRWAPGLAGRLLGGLSLVLPRSAEDAERVSALGARRVAAPADLKQSASPLPADPEALAALRDAIGARPVLLAASTHPGEEEQVVAAHRASGVPDLLTILAPRHPERGAALAALTGAARRSAGALPDAGPFHVADTIGELGLLYRVAGVAFIGGSLVPHGGQNPLEAVRLGCPALMGLHRGNFSELTGALIAAGALRPVADARALAEAVHDVLTNPASAEAMRRAAGGFADAAAHVPARMAEELLGLMSG